MKVFLKILFVNALVVFLSTSMVMAADYTWTASSNTDTDSTPTTFSRDRDRTSLPDFSRFKRDGQGSAASEEAAAKRAEFEAKRAELQTIRDAIKECVEASGIDMQETDMAAMKSTVDACLAEAGVDMSAFEAADAEAEARMAEFEAMRAEFDAKAKAIKSCMDASGVIDPENFDPKSVDTAALKEAMETCLAEAGIDVDAMKAQFEERKAQLDERKAQFEERRAQFEERKAQSDTALPDMSGVKACMEQIDFSVEDKTTLQDQVKACMEAASTQTP